MTDIPSSQGPVASVLVITFNHELYIKKCLDSILEQQVDFSYEIVVIDDCSTDRTSHILTEYSQKYPQIRYIRNPVNYGISNNNNMGISVCRGLYVSMLEGDDFWIDPLKLKREVTFLQSHSEYGFTGGACSELMPDGSTLSKSSDELGRWIFIGNVFLSAAKHPVTRTATLCFRRSIVLPYLDKVGAGNDTVLQAILAHNSFFARWSLPVAVYRRGGISNGFKSLERELLYNDYVVTNRRLKRELFPEYCKFDEDGLLDRGDYIRLKYAIKDNDWRKALKLKKSLRTKGYRKKGFSFFLLGPISCFILSIKLRRA